MQLSCAVISCGCMETDEEGFLDSHFLMQFYATVMNYFTAKLNLNGILQALAVTNKGICAACRKFGLENY